METQWSCSPFLAAKGQGHHALWLILTLLWSFGACLYPDSSHHISPSRTLWTPIPTAPDSPLLTTTVIPKVSPAARSLARDWSAARDFSTVRGGSLSSPVPLLGEVSTSADSAGEDSDGDLLPSHTVLPVTESEALQRSSFVPPSVSLYSTLAVSFDVGPTQLGVTSGADTVGVEVWGGATSLGSDDASAPLTIQSTLFVDSVAPSVRRDPTEGLYVQEVSVSHVQLSTQLDLGTGTSSTHEVSGSTLALIALSSSDEVFMLSSSEASVFQATGGGIEATVSIGSLLKVSMVTEMLEMNTTQAATIFQSTAGETTSSLLSTTPDMSSPGPSGANTSCTERDTGCVEYRGNEDEEEEELRIKIIIGAACGAILLVVILGVFIGCVLRRRGKMSSGSKIDLSSYWDDSVTLSYINGHVDIPKDSVDEMISLDNDSFLNSLDSMSFTNTWTSDTSKHTNF